MFGTSTVGYTQRTKSTRPPVDAKTGDRAVREWLRMLSGGKECRLEVNRVALRACGVDLTDKGEFGELAGMREIAFDLPPVSESRAAMSAQLGHQGGYLRSPGVIGGFEAALQMYDSMRRVATVTRTEDGSPVVIPTSNDVSVEGEIIGENADATETPPAFGAVVLRDFKFSSKRLIVPHELLEDADAAPAILGRLMGERIGRRQGRFFTGRLAAQATLGRAAASATSLSYADLAKLVGSVDPAYRENGTWQMHPDTLLAVREIVDLAGRPVLGGEGREPRLLGYPVVPNRYLDATLASGSRSVFFGDFSRFHIRDVREVRVVQMAERYRSADQVGFISFLRSDGQLVDAGTGPVKYIQH